MAVSGPFVYESIFKKYCRAKGPLRDFNVSEIVAKAAWVKKTAPDLYQREGLDVPEWVHQIPILP
jgi:hypothetical protein